MVSLDWNYLLLLLQLDSRYQTTQILTYYCYRKGRRSITTTSGTTTRCRIDSFYLSSSRNQGFRSFQCSTPSRNLQLVDRGWCRRCLAGIGNGNTIHACGTNGTDMVSFSICLWTGHSQGSNSSREIDALCVATQFQCCV